MTAVSVVMGTYNDGQTLAETLDSVLEQDFSDFEFIVVDDGSTDPGVSAVLSGYEEKDSRIRVLRKVNEGLTRALIDGCAAAQGTYVARIDAGDVMQPERLKEQARILDEYTDCAFVSCWTEFCGPEWEPLWLSRGRPAQTEPVMVLPVDAENGLLGDIPHHGSVMFRRSDYEQAGGYRPEFYYGQDWDLWYRLAEIGSYQVVPATLYRARIFPGSISMTRKGYQDEIATCSQQAFVARRRGGDESPWLHRASLCRPSTGSGGRHPISQHESGYYFIGEALRRRGDPRSRHYLARAMRAAPGSPRAYFRWLQSWLPAPGQAA